MTPDPALLPRTESSQAMEEAAAPPMSASRQRDAFETMCLASCTEQAVGGGVAMATQQDMQRACLTQCDCVYGEITRRISPDKLLPTLDTESATTSRALDDLTRQCAANSPASWMTAF